MKVIKRDGRAVDYDREKIRIAIDKANQEVRKVEKVSENLSNNSETNSNNSETNSFNYVHGISTNLSENITGFHLARSITLFNGDISKWKFLDVLFKC